MMPQMLADAPEVAVRQRRRYPVPAAAAGCTSVHQFSCHIMPRRVNTRTPPGWIWDRARSALMSVPGGPDVSRERPAHPGQVGIGEAGAGQVRAGEIVQGTVRQRRRQSFRRRDAEAAGQALRAEPVQGTGAAEAGADAIGELAGQFEVAVTGESQPQVQMGGKDAVDSLAEFTAEFGSSAEAAGQGQRKVITPGLAGGQSAGGPRETAVPSWRLPARA